MFFPLMFPPLHNEPEEERDSTRCQRCGHKVSKHTRHTESPKYGCAEKGPVDGHCYCDSVVKG